ncbi:MAG: uroporphyrinogen-III C-methyltransferase [Burkholderiaceae bacterium]
MSSVGTVYLVGAGPGAPDLLTLRAAHLLAAADIVFHDALVHPDTIAFAGDAIKVPVGKRHGRLSSAQHFINKRLVDAAREHAVVVRLKGGDPMLFGRAQEEMAALRAAGVPFEVVPGVTAALAAAAELKTSLTRRVRGIDAGSRSVVFVTPRVGTDRTTVDAEAEDRHTVERRWIDAVNAADTAVLYMASRDADRIAAALIADGRDGTTPVAVVENASLPGSSMSATTLGALAENGLSGLDGPATIIVGTAMRDALVDASVDSSRGTADAFERHERCRTA